MGEWKQFLQQAAGYRMTNTNDNQGNMVLAEASTTGCPSTRSSAGGSIERVSVPDRSVYLATARTLLPRWLYLVGEAPWLHGSWAARGSAQGLYRQQAATLGIATLTSLEDERPESAYLRECVRTSLVHWQLSLRSDGRPAGRSARSPIHAAICAAVVQLLTETMGYQTKGLLEDVSRHLRWLARRPLGPSHLEAAAIWAMADGAVLCRDGSLLHRARNRLGVLLTRQSDEGWFVERGGADIGWLSLTVDALARVFRLCDWDELAEPLRHALRFLLHFAYPDGLGDGCCGPYATRFLSPYGVELLAPIFPDAAQLALVCRRRFARFQTPQPYGWHDDLCGTLGASVALAAVEAASKLNAPDAFPYQRLGQTHFPQAGVSIFSTKAYYAVASGRKGGALHVTWRGGEPPLDDPGISVAFSHRMRTSSRNDPRTRFHATRSSLTSSGILRAVERTWARRARWSWRLARWLAVSLGSPRQGLLRRLARRLDPDRLTHDRFQRAITFGEDWIRIRDLVRCRLPCRTIICQSPPPDRTPAPVAAVGPRAHPPIFVEGGRRVEITRLYRHGKLVGQGQEA